MKREARLGQAARDMGRGLAKVNTRPRPLTLHLTPPTFKSTLKRASRRSAP